MGNIAAIIITVLVAFTIALIWRVIYHAMLRVKLESELEKLRRDSNNSYKEICRNKRVFKRIIEEITGDHQEDSLFCNSIEPEINADLVLQKLQSYKEMLNDMQKCIANKHSKEEIAVKMLFESNVSAIPYFAGIMADFSTVGYGKIIESLEWGNSEERKRKVASIKAIKNNAEEQIQQAKIAQYQIEYLCELYPGLRDIVDEEYSRIIAFIDPERIQIPEHDYAKDYLSKEEWLSLDTTERNQIALDRYVNGHNKSKWQIGRDYELYIGHVLNEMGYEVVYFGSLYGLEDLGRDLIAEKDGHTWVAQCKLWGKDKIIHEKHIAQLYGTTVSYRIEKGLPEECVHGIFVTNITLSDMAKTFCEKLAIRYIENLEMGEFPRIKCNIGRDEFGVSTNIYHLPFDQQYDRINMSKKGCFFAFTVKEAENAGFRRAYRWYRDK